MRVARFFAAILVAGLLTGCGSSHRLAQFRTFANAGQEYADAVDTLAEEAGGVAIDADSDVLVLNHADFDAAGRDSLYEKHTEKVVDLLDEIGKFRTHTWLLAEYFDALAALAESEAAGEIGEEAASTAEALAGVGLVDAHVGDGPLSDFVEAAVPIVVAELQNQALERELNRNAEAVERELALQKAFLDALAAGMKKDLELSLEMRSNLEVVGPYGEDGRLPSSWKRDRREILTATTQTDLVDGASRAAAELRAAFVALVENETSAEQLQSLARDTGRILDVVDLVRTGRGNEEE